MFPPQVHLVVQFLKNRGLIMMKEGLNFGEIQLVQTGDKVEKAGKRGEVIQVANDGVLVNWQDGAMTSEKPEGLKKVFESVFTQYLKECGRL